LQTFAHISFAVSLPQKLAFLLYYIFFVFIP